MSTAQSAHNDQPTRVAVRGLILATLARPVGFAGTALFNFSFSGRPPRCERNDYAEFASARFPPRAKLLLQATNRLRRGPADHPKVVEQYAGALRVIAKAGEPSS